MNNPSFAIIWSSVGLSVDLIVLFLILLPRSENALKEMMCNLMSGYSVLKLVSLWKNDSMVGNVQARGEFTKGWNDCMEGD